MKRKAKKNTNVISHEKFTVMIYDGMELIGKNSEFETAAGARASAERIIKTQRELLGEGMTAYAMVFDKKRMLYYID